MIIFKKANGINSIKGKKEMNKKQKEKEKSTEVRPGGISIIPAL